MTSPMPFIKNEPDDQNFSFNMYGSFGSNNQQFGGWQSQSLPNGDVGGDLSSGSLARSAMGSQQNPSSNFIAGTSALNDDDLAADFIDYDTGSQMQQNNSSNFGNSQQQSLGISTHLMHNNQNQTQAQSFHDSQQQQSYLQHIFSNTPPGNGPVQSAYTSNSNYSQWSSLPSHSNRLPRNQRQHSASLLRNGSGLAGATGRNDPTVQDSRSQMSPALANARIGTPDSRGFDSHAIPVAQEARAHRQNGSSQWENGIGSANSFLDSPALSPLTASAHPPISSVMTSNNYSSFTAKSENPVPSSLPTTAAEAKKRRRRESHNAVERRRRDNINDRIGQLSNLVPVYRLDDDRVRKQTNSSVGGAPSSYGNGMSPPQSASFGGTGRRTVGSITQGLPIDDKDKNPAKGDVLNGAVTWTRDLMWLLYRKIQQEAIMIEHIQSIGSQPPIEFREDEQRMQTELLAAIERNGGPDGFEYSRADGSGLYVPSHTNHSGGRLSSDSATDFDANFPTSGIQSNYGNQDSFPWDFNPDNESNRNSLELKEEDEFGMDMT